MLLFLESPVGIAILKPDFTVVSKYIFSSPEEAYNIYNNIFSEEYKNFLKLNISETLIVSSENLVKNLNEILKVEIISNEKMLKNLKKNTFKYFGVNKNVYNMMTQLLTQKINSLNNTIHLNTIDNISLLDSIESMELNINNRIMRMKEWYSLHFPEISKIEDNKKYLELILFIGNRKDFILKNTNIVINEDNVQLNEDNSQIDVKTNNEDLENIFDKNDINYYLNLAKNSMGSDLSEIDTKTILENCKDILQSIFYKESLFDLLEKSCSENIPNLYKLVGALISTKLIRKVGSLSKLSQESSSTIQILGAEKAYLEAMNNCQNNIINTPKYGYIYNSLLISKANKKGRVARALANKIALCAKVDLSGESKDGKFGEKCNLNITKLLEIKEKAIKKKILTKKRIISVNEYDERHYKQ